MLNLGGPWAIEAEMPNRQLVAVLGAQERPEPGDIEGAVEAMGVVRSLEGLCKGRGGQTELFHILQQPWPQSRGLHSPTLTCGMLPKS